MSKKTDEELKKTTRAVADRVFHYPGRTPQDKTARQAVTDAAFGYPGSKGAEGEH